MKGTDEKDEKKKEPTYTKVTTKKLKKVTTLSMEGHDVLDEFEEDTSDIRNKESEEAKKRIPEINKIIQYLL